MKSTKLLVTRETIYETKELKSLVHVDTEININLKIVTQKTDITYQSYNIIKDTITLTSYYVIYLAEDW